MPGEAGPHCTQVRCIGQFCCGVGLAAPIAMQRRRDGLNRVPGGQAQFGGLPTMPNWHCAGGGVVGLPVPMGMQRRRDGTNRVPAGQAQFGGVPIMPNWH
jgi:hypothetical protein